MTLSLKDSDWLHLVEGRGLRHKPKKPGEKLAETFNCKLMKPPSGLSQNLSLCAGSPDTQWGISGTESDCFSSSKEEGQCR